jgi:hypothetical protein
VNRGVGVWHPSRSAPQRTQLLEQHQKLKASWVFSRFSATLRLHAKIQFMNVRYPLNKTKKVGTSI